MSIPSTHKDESARYEKMYRALSYIRQAKEK